MQISNRTQINPEKLRLAIGRSGPPKKAVPELVFFQKIFEKKPKNRHTVLATILWGKARFLRKMFHYFFLKNFLESEALFLLIFGDADRPIARRNFIQDLFEFY